MNHTINKAHEILKDNCPELFFKNGKLKGLVAHLVMNAIVCGRTYTVDPGTKYRRSIDYTIVIIAHLLKCGFKVETGNNAPRGGMTGKYVKIF